MSKRNLYLLPGTMCDQRLWQPMADELEQLAPNCYQFHYLTIAQLDTIEEIIQDIKCQIKLCHGKALTDSSKLGLTINEQPVALIGFSLGGYLASAFTLQFPELVEKLMLVANMSGKLAEKDLKERKRTISWLKRYGYNGIPLKRIHVLLDESARQNNIIIDLIKQMDSDLGQEILIHQLTATTQRFDLLPNIIASTIHTQFCIGENDCLVDINKLGRFCEASETSELSVIKNTGHMLPLESPGKLAKAIHEYFSVS